MRKAIQYAINDRKSVTLVQRATSKFTEGLFRDALAQKNSAAS